MSVIQSVARSHSNSPNPSSFCTYEIRPNNSLSFQHLQNSSDLFIPKPLKVLLKSTLTSCLSLTPPESTPTKNRGVGEGASISCPKRSYDGLTSQTLRDLLRRHDRIHVNPYRVLD